MKKINYSIFALFTLIQAFLAAEIIETNDIHDIKNYIKPETLVIFDIDNTLIEPVQTLGSDQWFYHRLESSIAKGTNKNDALHKTIAEWSAIQQVTKVKEVQPGTKELIAELQNKGYIIMGLTTRGLGLSTRTIDQLQSVGIDLAVTAPTHAEIFFINNHSVLFRGGTLFTAGTHKGMALIKFLGQIKLAPESVVFINDKRQNIEEVDEICNKCQIPFIGLRYGYLDEKVKSFKNDLADLQLKHFGYIISDDEAEKMLSEK